MRLGFAQMLEKDESRDDVAVASRSFGEGDALLLETACHARERFVRQVFGGAAVLAREVVPQPPANLDVRIAVGVRAAVEPVEEPLERLLGQRPLFTALERVVANVRHACCLGCRTTLVHGLVRPSPGGFKPIVEGGVDCGVHLQAQGEVAERLKAAVC
jgi:hypothetical protein